MKGIGFIPKQAELIQAYNLLQFNSKEVKVEEVALWSQWSRLDPRLAQILVHYLVQEWQNINPILLNIELKKQAWQSAIAPLLEFAYLSLKQNKLDYKVFQAWMKAVLIGLSAGENEQFFIGQRSFAGKLSKLDVQLSLSPYSKWGYFSRDHLIQLKLRSKNKCTLLNSNQRYLIIQNHLKKKSRITANDLIELSQNMISQRQAELDLKAFPGLKKIGNTKGCFYVLK